MENSAKRWILGLIFIALGTLFLLDNFDIIDFRIPYYLWRWEMIFVIIGVISLINGNYSAAIIFISIGVTFWITNFYSVGIRDLWPIALIAVGLSILIKRSSLSSKKKSDYAQDSFDDVAVFAGNEKVINTNNFTGGKLTSVFGGSDVDLRQCELQEGTTVIDVFTMFGGCEIKVPAEWTVHVEVTTILGGFEDKRREIVQNADDSRILVIKGFTMFGGGEIKN